MPGSTPRPRSRRDRRVRGSELSPCGIAGLEIWRGSLAYNSPAARDRLYYKSGRCILSPLTSLLYSPPTLFPLYMIEQHPALARSVNATFLLQLLSLLFCLPVSLHIVLLLLRRRRKQLAYYYYTTLRLNTRCKKEKATKKSNIASDCGDRGARAIPVRPPPIDGTSSNAVHDRWLRSNGRNWPRVRKATADSTSLSVGVGLL